MKWDAGNPTGHGIIFIGPQGQVYCYVTAARTPPRHSGGEDAAAPEGARPRAPLVYSWHRSPRNWAFR
jgi:hypothetical protein